MIEHEYTVIEQIEENEREDGYFRVFKSKDYHARLALDKILQGNHSGLTKELVGSGFFKELLEYADTEQFPESIDFSGVSGEYESVGAYLKNSPEIRGSYIALTANSYKQYKSVSEKKICSETPNHFIDALHGGVRESGMLIKANNGMAFAKRYDYISYLIHENGVWNSLGVLSDYFDSLVRKSLWYGTFLEQNKQDILSKYHCVKSIETIGGNVVLSVDADITYKTFTKSFIKSYSANKSCYTLPEDLESCYNVANLMIPELLCKIDNNAGKTITTLSAKEVHFI